MSAMAAAISFDKVDMDYYRTQCVQLRESASLLEAIKTKGIMEVSKVQLDGYHDATWEMNMATATYEYKTGMPLCCNTLCCAWHGYCYCCCACYSLDISRRRGKLNWDRANVKEFLRAQELRSQGFTNEQLVQMRTMAQSALDSGDGPQMMKTAEELDLMDRKLSAGAAMAANMPAMGAMMQQMQMGQMGGMQGQPFMQMNAQQGQPFMQAQSMNR